MGACEFVTEHANYVECNFGVFAQNTKEHFGGYLHRKQVTICDQRGNSRGIVEQTQFAYQLILRERNRDDGTFIRFGNDIDGTFHNKVHAVADLALVAQHLLVLCLQHSQEAANLACDCAA